MPPGDADAIIAVTLARDIHDEDERHEMFLAVALEQTRKIRQLIEDNADRAEPDDALTLRQVYAAILDVSAGIAPVVGAMESARQARDLAVLVSAPTERPLRLVR